MNVAHQEIDIARPAENRRNAGFTDEERAGFSALLAAGFLDTFRHFHPDRREAYSWWSFRGGARSRNVGWRIDYFGVSARLAPRLTAAAIHPEITGSDHCPVSPGGSFCLLSPGCSRWTLDIPCWILDIE